ncbi:hypothetical protein [Amycolatopsis saalfeldensis]|uniref:Uncharacterized protein n=1 Tax=Amycolatopsis saalfeldensis TaxID=394193 RepID=A0A1H8YN45_9PSEU|nr:hypothetical protein [Amycolatopsis saalfeldensis]SEP53615.1 hypothetical protein SAMN04489732_12940 [Amycolatopsis saalfeldensis]
MVKPKPESVLRDLQACDRIRNSLPGLRATVLALGWSVGLRNINELAREVDLSRGTIYKDLRSRGINPKLRDEPVEPTYPPMSGQVIADLASLIAAYAAAFRQEGEPPTSDPKFVFCAGALLQLVGRLVETPPDDAIDDDWKHEDSRAWRLVDILDDLETLLEITCSALAENTTDAQAAKAFSRTAMTDTAFDAYVEAATFRLSLPDGRTVNVEITRDEGELLTIRGDDPREDTQADRREHLALVNGFRLMAEAMKPRFSTKSPQNP